MRSPSSALLLPSRLLLLCGVLLLEDTSCSPPGAVVVTQSLPHPLVPCPAPCACQTKPWFSPVESVYREAPTVDCNALLLTRLPSPLPRDTHTLRLQSNLLSSGLLESAALRALPNLTELDLSQNRLGRGGVGTQNLSLLPSLRSLHLEENRLARLPHGAFHFVPALQELFLSHNRLRWLAPGALAGLGSLLRLHLDNNRLRSVDPRWFGALPRLEVLMLGGNPVEVLPEQGFRALGSSLRSLMLGGMGLRGLAESALGGLDRLESLSFYDNLLSRVPARALRRVPGLKFLDLNKNRIGLLETGDFRDMVYLKELGLNNMETLVSIERAALDNLPELTKLEITNNPRLSYVHPDAFRRLGRLESLMLNSNALSALHRRTLRSLPSLREVSLHSNPLRCDCLFRWAAEEASRPAHTDEVAPTTTPAGRRTPRAVRFIQPRATLCSDPPELRARRVRDVSANEMSASCLPVIASAPLPPHVGVREGGSLALHCRAQAEPQPQLYWVTPSGLRLGPAAVSHDDNNTTPAPPPPPRLGHAASRASADLTNSSGPSSSEGGDQHAFRRPPDDSSSGNYRLLPEGTLEIWAVNADQAGLYTCVAENALGADTRSVTVGLRTGGRRTTRTDLSSAGRTTEAEAVLDVREVGEHYAVLSWRGGHGGLPSTRLSWQAVVSSSSSSSSISSSSSVHSRPTAYTTRILAGTQSFNLTHLRAETFYRVCLHPGGVSGDSELRAPRRRRRRRARESAPPHCVTIRTKVPPATPEPPHRLLPRPAPSTRLVMTAFSFYTPHLTLMMCMGVFMALVSHYRPERGDREGERKYLEALRQELEARGVMAAVEGGDETLCGCACVSLDCRGGEQRPRQSEKAALLQEC